MNIQYQDLQSDTFSQAAGGQITLWLWLWNKDLQEQLTLWLVHGSQGPHALQLLSLQSIGDGAFSSLVLLWKAFSEELSNKTFQYSPGQYIKSHVSLYLNHRPIFWKHLQADFCFTFVAVLTCINSCLILNSLVAYNYIKNNFEDSISQVFSSFLDLCEYKCSSGGSCYWREWNNNTQRTSAVSYSDSGCATQHVKLKTKTQQHISNGCSTSIHLCDLS